MTPWIKLFRRLQAWRECRLLRAAKARAALVPESGWNYRTEGYVGGPEQWEDYE